MFIRYFSARKSWVLLFVGLLSLTNALLLLDKGLSVAFTSILYLNALYLLFFLIFFSWRFRKETKYAAALVSLQQTKAFDWMESLPEPENGLDQITDEILREEARLFKRKLFEYKEAQTIENDFTASWIHEIKTPLTAMKLMLEAKQRETDMSKIEAEWLRIHLLIDRKLYITRLPALESDYVLESSSIQRLVAEEVRELAPWCMEKNLAVSIEGMEVMVVTDRKWCRFVLRQLLTNSVKYSPADAAIVIETGVTDTGTVILDLKDEGPGIKPHDLPRIFDKGFTGENGRIQNAATGQGLYLARTVADKMGIGLKVQSSSAQGTVMRMIFPDPNDFESLRRRAAI